MSLPFHADAFTELFEQDGLLVMAKGLGLNKLLLKFLRLHCRRDTLVFVLNCNKYSHDPNFGIICSECKTGFAHTDDNKYCVPKETVDKCESQLAANLQASLTRQCPTGPASSV